MSSGAFIPLQSGQGAALTVVVGFAVLSLTAVDFVWLRMAWIAVSQLFRRGSLQSIKRERAIFHSQLGAYMGSLLLSNLLSSVSFIINGTWIMEQRITIGGLCTSQAALSQVADVATAYFTAAIAVHTFNSLVLKFRLPFWFCGLMVLVGWAVAIVIAIFPMHTETKLGPFYSVNAIFCDISPEYPLFETVIHLVPIFAASIIAAIFYSLVFLILRGTISIRGGLKLNLDPEARRNTAYDTFEYPRFIAAIARSMLWFPVAYIVLMLPHLATCLLSASGFKVSNSWRVITATASAMLGLANVLVFYNTIRTMGPAFNGPARAVNTAKSESFINEKSNSPVDVAPPVAAMLAPARSFPPPRDLRASSKPSMESLSVRSIGGESSRALLLPQAAHMRQGSSSSSDSSTSLSSINRPITAASKLNQMLMTEASASRPQPRLNLRAIEEQTESLPAPRRDGRSPVVRHSTLSSIAPPQPSAALTAVPLKTPLASAESSYASRRSSFINMYATRSAAPTGSSTDSDYAQMPSFGGSPGYSSTDDSDVPRSAFVQNASLPSGPRANRSLRSEVRTRLGQEESPDSAGLSSLAWATLVAHAATSNGGMRTEPSAEVKTTRRRSKSLGNLTVPSNLRPSNPSAARVPADVSRARSVAAQRSGVSRWDSKATFHQGPSKTPQYRAVDQPGGRV